MNKRCCNEVRPQCTVFNSLSQKRYVCYPLFILFRQDNAFYEWSYKKAATVYAYCNYHSVPVPFNIISLTFLLMRYLCKKICCKKCSTADIDNDPKEVGFLWIACIITARCKAWFKICFLFSGVLKCIKNLLLLLHFLLLLFLLDLKFGGLFPLWSYNCCWLWFLVGATSKLYTGHQGGRYCCFKFVCHLISDVT